jgi:hypothetical protein
VSLNLILYFGVSVAALLALAGTFVAVLYSLAVDTFGEAPRPRGIGVAVASLNGISVLTGTGAFQVTIFRQSGSIHAQYAVADAAAAIQKAIATFKRAGIAEIEVTRNTQSELHFARVGCGTGRGRTVGEVEIRHLG